MLHKSAPHILARLSDRKINSCKVSHYNILIQLQLICSRGYWLPYIRSHRTLDETQNNNHKSCEILLTKANQKFGILKCTCHFVTCKNRRGVLYLALVRSQFEHCSPVWRPGSITIMNKFGSFQKKCLKWILSEEEKILLSCGLYK